MSVQSNIFLMSCLSATLLLSGCGSGTTDQVIDSITPPALEDGPGGRFYGYYLQTPHNPNPKSDIGGLYLSLPSSGGSFSGRMSYQFYQCQGTNKLDINGTKLTAYLKAATVTGTFDLPSVGNLTGFMPIFLGTFGGSYSREGDNYKGQYTRQNKAGDDDAPSNCGDYTVADKGSWQVFKETKVYPATFNVTQTTGLIHWTPVANATKALIMVVNPSNVGTGSNALVKQMLITSTPAIPLPLFIAAPADIPRGSSYLTVVELFDDKNQLVAFKTLPTIF